MKRFRLKPTSPFPGRSGPLLFALVAGGLGFVANGFPVRVFGGTEIVFGGSLTLLAAFAYGPACGGLAAALAFARTWFTWGHPWGALCFGLEAVAVGWLVQRRGLGGIAADAIYWAVLGVPLAALGMFGFSDFPFPSTWAVVFKYPLNGVLTALLATPIFHATAFRRVLQLPAAVDADTPLQHVLFRRFGVIAALPIAALSLLVGRSVDQRLRVQAEELLRDDAAFLAARLHAFLDEHQRALTALASAAADWPREAEARSRRLRELRSLYPGFLTMLATDREGRIVGAASADETQDAALVASGQSVADRDYFRAAMATRRTCVSGVFRGRGFGNDLIVAVSAPVLDHDGWPAGIVEGSLNLSALPAVLTRNVDLDGRDLVIVDQTQHVVFAMGAPGLGTLARFHDRPVALATHRRHVVVTYDAVTPDHRLERHLAIRQRIADYGWQVYLQEPLWRTQRTVAAFYLVTVLWATAAVAIAILLARRTAIDVTRPLTELARSAAALARDEEPARTLPADYPARELTAIGRDVHHAAVTLRQSNRRLAGAIDERDRSHAQLLQVLFHLDEKVSARTTQLEAARRAAESANTAKGEFLASMSHELRTPLNVILGMAEVLTERHQGPLTAAQAECVAAVEDSGRHLLAVINDILDFSKIDAGMMHLEIQETSVRDVCESSLRLVREAAHKKRIRLESAHGQTAETVPADGRRLKQILVNLLSNAVKFTPDGGAVTLAVAQLESPPRIRFSVRDTGIGIAPQHVAELFQPFHQIEGSLTRKYEGTGLGLALVKRMTEMHGGTVALASEPGCGSDFSVTLPLAATPPAGVRPDAARGLLNGTDPQIAGEPLILIAEDNPVNVHVYTAHLSRWKCRYTFARNGREAVERALADRPDLVLMDVQMPEMDGLEATRILRADARTRHLPIVAVTALAMREDRLRCLEAGANSYLSKPVQLRELTRQIAELLATPPASNSTPRP